MFSIFLTFANHSCSTDPPVATLELTGSTTERGTTTTNGVAVLEGEDVQFTCNIDANPPIYRISWFRYVSFEQKKIKIFVSL